MRAIIDDLDSFAATVRHRMAEKGHIRKSFVKIAKVSDGVLGKVLAGKRVHNNTIVKIARALEIDLEDPYGKLYAGLLSRLGTYSRASISEHEGSFLAFRPSLDGQPSIRCVGTVIKWDDGEGCLSFRECGKANDNSTLHEGRVLYSAEARVSYLISAAKGAVRTVALNHPVPNVMQGMVMTVYNSSESAPMPVATPILYKKVTEIEVKRLGTFPFDDKNIGDLVKELRESISAVRFLSL